MMCRNPFTRGVQAYGCGQCIPCRLNRRRLWTHRLMLETTLHSSSVFVTLTYSDDALSYRISSRLPQLEPYHLQTWLKRIRKAAEPLRLRFYAVGEYGDVSFRPHYHVALFGYPLCSRGRSSFRKYGDGRVSCCAHCDLIASTWGHGAVDVGTLELASASYVAGYVTKKMTSADDPRLKGRQPEFARMSLRPGIGKDAMVEVANALQRFNLDQSQPDVPSALRHGGRLLPLGRYLRRKLRAQLGKEESAPPFIDPEMFELRVAARNDPENPSFKSHVINNGNQKALNAMAKAKMKGKKYL